MKNIIWETNPEEGYARFYRESLEKMHGTSDDYYPLQLTRGQNRAIKEAKKRDVWREIML